MISIIAAMSKNHVIGNHGMIPWKIKGEQKRFRELTIGRTIIMGRISFEEIGYSLPDRKTILISSTRRIEAENCVTVTSLTEALELVKYEKEIFIAGGGSVYSECMPLTDRIYLTVIDREVKGDTFFPEIDSKSFRVIYEKRIEGDTPYTYYTYERNKPIDKQSE